MPILKDDPEKPEEGRQEPADVIVLPSGAEILSLDDILKTELFDDVEEKPVRAVLQRFKKNWDEYPPIWRRTFEDGDIICEEGDFDQTAFFILEGKVSIYIAAQLGHIESKTRKRKGILGFFRKHTTAFSRTRKDDSLSDETTRLSIPTDSPIDLAVDDPVGYLHKGDLFGEQTCSNYLPRSATVKAVGKCVCLEMIAPVLRAVKENSPRFNEEYKDRALKNHLMNVPMFSGFHDEVFDFLKDKIELVTKYKGEVIFREGEKADAFYLIRSGFVKVSQKKPGGETVLKYMGRGEHIGHIGIIQKTPREVTCTALNTAELVKVSEDHFREMLAEFPEVNKQFYRSSNKFQALNAALAQRTQTFAIRNFLDQGLMEANNLLLLDLEKCTRCDECVKACADSHDGVTRLNRVGLRFDKYLVATSCRSCSDPVCMPVCPVGSIRRRDTLEIVIEDWCIGCTKCADACPYGNINMHEMESPDSGADEEEAPKKKARAKSKAITCDLCTDAGGDPMCVYACPHDAAHRVPRDQFAEYFPTIFDQSETSTVRSTKVKQKQKVKG
ncbi:MAG: cyclic nucleotide-binding domain-containing protein [Candidatus Omnitrophica bacterium]|nr:cyclic nucleotide-binding domain-containing protein [Candidatus Omnitrophota bacterium]MCB9782047.1 cyclic nucleotide-binding domain-containing protein [Candidatus Omnitrophota bacterium]